MSNIYGSRSKLEYKPNIQYVTGTPAKVEFDYDVKVSITDIDDQNTIDQSVPDKTQDLVDKTITYITNTINALKTTLTEVTVNASPSAMESLNLPTTISFADYVDASITQTPTINQQTITDLFEESAASIRGNAQVEAAIEFVDDWKDLIITKKYYDDLLRFCFNDVTAEYNSLINQLGSGQSSLASLSEQLMTLDGDEAEQIASQADNIQLSNEIVRNKLNIIANISDLVGSKVLDSQYMISSLATVTSSTLSDYFADLTEEIYSMIGDTTNLSTRLKQLTTVLRINYERDKNAVINLRKAFLSAHPKSNLTKILANINKNSKISLEICSQLLYNNNSSESNTYLSTLLVSEIENNQSDLNVALEQLYVYIKELHAYRAQLLSLIASKNKKRILYLVIEDLTKKSDNISDAAMLRIEIDNSVKTIGE